MNKRVYRVQEFARLTGVTVRTLHHYDRLGLLRPSGRTDAGYRLYGEADIRQLQQITTLKFIGFSLKQIRELLTRSTDRFGPVLHRQRLLLEERRAHIDRAIRAIGAAEKRAERAEENADAFLNIIQVINMNNRKSWMLRYFSPEGREKMAARLATWTPEQQAHSEREWAVLVADVERAIASGVDPAGPEGQALGERWTRLIEGFTQGDPDITECMQKVAKDRENWPVDYKAPYSPEVESFIAKVHGISPE